MKKTRDLSISARALLAGVILTTSALPALAEKGAAIQMPVIKLTPPLPPLADYAGMLARAFEEAGTGNYGRAIADTEKSLAIAEEQLGASDETVMHIAGTLAEFHLANNEYDEARQLIERTLRIEGKPFDASAVELAIATKLSRVGRSLEFADPPRFSQATSFLRQALATREKVLGYEHPIVASSLYDLANNMIFMEKFAEGETLFKRAIAISEKDVGKNETNKNNLVVTLNEMGLMYMKQRRYKDAETVLRRALAVAERQPKADDSVTVQILHSLRQFYNETGRRADEDAMTQRAQGLGRSIKNTHAPAN